MANVEKSMRGGYSAKSTVAISNGRTLQINTFKSSLGAVVTHATAGRFEDGHFSFMMFGDYSKQIVQEKHGRVTAKVVGEQHDEVMGKLMAAVKAEAEAFYVKEAAEQ